MPRKDPPLTHQEAFERYYGGMTKIVKQSLPFKCECGSTTYKKFDEELAQTIEVPVMTVEDCFRHIRKAHKERIKK